MKDAQTSQGRVPKAIKFWVIGLTPARELEVITNILDEPRALYTGIAA